MNMKVSAIRRAGACNVGTVPKKTKSLFGSQCRMQNANRCRNGALKVIRAFSDDEDIVPIVTGTRKKGFTNKELEMLRHPKLLGGQTIGDELEMLRNEYLKVELDVKEKSEHELVSKNWDGDVYVGSQWNTLSILSMTFFGTTALIGIFAWLSYGHLWGITPGLYN